MTEELERYYEILWKEVIKAHEKNKFDLEMVRSIVEGINRTNEVDMMDLKTIFSYHESSNYCEKISRLFVKIFGEYMGEESRKEIEDDGLRMQISGIEETIFGLIKKIIDGRLDFRE